MGKCTDILSRKRQVGTRGEEKIRKVKIVMMEFE
jgi:hypothetical protein